MPRRRERVAPPPHPGGWDIRYADNAAAKGWVRVCRESPSNARAAWDALTAEPRHRSPRQHPLKGSRRTRLVNHVEMDQWQYEITGAGRIWYCIEDTRKTVWLTWAERAIPKQQNNA